MEDFSEGVFTVEAATRSSHAADAAALLGVLDSLGVQPGGSVKLYHRIAASDGEASTVSETARLTLLREQSVSAEGLAGVPTALTLAPAYPNPFRTQATIRYGLPEAAMARLMVYDLLGRPVRVLAEGRQAAGWYEVHLRAGGLASGLYIYRLETERRVLTGRIVLVE